MKGDTGTSKVGALFSQIYLDTSRISLALCFQLLTSSWSHLCLGAEVAVGCFPPLLLVTLQGAREMPRIKDLRRKGQRC